MLKMRLTSNLRVHERTVSPMSPVLGQKGKVMAKVRFSVAVAYDSRHVDACVVVVVTPGVIVDAVAVLRRNGKELGGSVIVADVNGEEGGRFLVQEAGKGREKFLGRKALGWQTGIERDLECVW